MVPQRAVKVVHVGSTYFYSIFNSTYGLDRGICLGICMLYLFLSGKYIVDEDRPKQKLPSFCAMFCFSRVVCGRFFPGLDLFGWWEIFSLFLCFFLPVTTVQNIFFMKIPCCCCFCDWKEPFLLPFLFLLFRFRLALWVEQKGYKRSLKKLLFLLLFFCWLFCFCYFVCVEYFHDNPFFAVVIVVCRFRSPRHPSTLSDQRAAWRCRAWYWRCCRGPRRPWGRKCFREPWISPPHRSCRAWPSSLFSASSG